MLPPRETTPFPPWKAPPAGGPPARAAGAATSTAKAKRQRPSRRNIAPPLDADARNTRLGGPEVRVRIPDARGRIPYRRTSPAQALVGGAMRQVATLIVAAAVVAVPQAAAKEPFAPRSVFGIAWHNRQTSMAELDARTLAPISKSVTLGKAGWLLGRAPGGGMRAAFTVGESGDAIRFVNLAKMRPERRVQLPCSISRAMLWGTADRLVTTC